MKIDKLRDKSNSDLEKLIVEKKDKLRILRFNLAAGKAKNINEIKETKKDIARILTILTEIKNGKGKK